MDAAARLSVDSGGSDLSVADIAQAAGVFPNQITYHFGSKDALLVHAAFLGLLHDAERLELLGAQAADADAFRRSLSRVVLSLPSLPAVARALAAGISRPGLSDVVDTHLQLLFRQSERYLKRLLVTRGWTTVRPAAVEVRTFWSAALGAVLLSHAGVSGTASDLDLAGVLSIR